jgi:hypothetical protein
MALSTTYRRCLLACRLGTAVGALACNGIVLSSACAFWRELHSPSAEPAVPRTACTLEHPTARCWRKEAAACSVRTACARRARSRHHSAFCTPARSSGPRACRARTPPPSSSTSSLVTILPLGAHAFLRAHCMAHARGLWQCARLAFACRRVWRTGRDVHAQVYSTASGALLCASAVVPIVITFRSSHTALNLRRARTRRAHVARTRRTRSLLTRGAEWIS